MSSEPEKKEFEIGILKTIRYQNDTGFLIGVFENQHPKNRRYKTFSGLGNMLQPEPGIAYKLFGQWKANGQWGDQYKFSFYEILQPTDTKGIYQYLVRVCKWIGPTVASRVVDSYGENALDVLRTDPVRVAKEINGITAKRAQEIQNNLQENVHIETVLVELERILAPIEGLRKSLPVEIVRRWGSNALVKLKKNPYLLTRIKGVGFPSADKIAISMGFDRKSVFRERAAVQYLINNHMQTSGSIWIRVPELCIEVTRLTGLVCSCIDGMVENQMICLKNKMVADCAADADETYVARKVAGMVKRSKIGFTAFNANK